MTPTTNTAPYDRDVPAWTVRPGDMAETAIGSDLVRVTSVDDAGTWVAIHYTTAPPRWTYRATNVRVIRA